FYWGYDAAEKKFVELGVDNGGTYMHGTSDGPQSGVWVWNEEGTMMGKKMKSRTTVTQKTPDTTQVKSEMEAEPGKWIPMGEDDGKKQSGSAYPARRPYGVAAIGPHAERWASVKSGLTTRLSRDDFTPASITAITVVASAGVTGVAPVP